MHIKHDPTPGTDISDAVNFGSSRCWSGRFPENLRRAALEKKRLGVVGVVILGHVHYCDEAGGTGTEDNKSVVCVERAEKRTLGVGNSKTPGPNGLLKRHPTERSVYCRALICMRDSNLCAGLFVGYAHKSKDLTG
jgi:hypothetical protein